MLVPRLALAPSAHRRPGLLGLALLLLGRAAARASGRRGLPRSEVADAADRALLHSLLQRLGGRGRAGRAAARAGARAPDGRPRSRAVAAHARGDDGRHRRGQRRRQRGALPADHRQHHRAGLDVGAGGLRRLARHPADARVHARRAPRHGARPAARGERDRRLRRARQGVVAQHRPAALDGRGSGAGRGVAADLAGAQPVDAVRHDAAHVGARARLPVAGSGLQRRQHLPARDLGVPVRPALHAVHRQPLRPRQAARLQPRLRRSDDPLRDQPRDREGPRRRLRAAVAGVRARHHPPLRGPGPADPRSGDPRGPAPDLLDRQRGLGAVHPPPVLVARRSAHLLLSRTTATPTPASAGSAAPAGASARASASVGRA